MPIMLHLNAGFALSPNFSKITLIIQDGSRSCVVNSAHGRCRKSALLCQPLSGFGNIPSHILATATFYG